uniref:Variant surface glycoprotein 1125.5566 n=1 Tax=Trypanosoma brucei TaxID=5691 RepID=A0A1J0RD34_9TRYP|nr:variant surface glycoprotein 1125.5566 [Trypanosoma brucei]
MRALKITNEADIKPTKITVTADATNPSSSTLKVSTGGRFCIDTRDSGGNTANLSTKSIAIRDLAMETKPVPAALNIDTTASGDQTPALKANHVRLLTTDSMLAKAFKAEQTTRAPITKLISEGTSDTLSSKRGCQAAGAAALEGKLLDSKTKTEINKLALKHLGGEGKNIGEQFFTKLKNDKITIPTTADLITGTTEELANSEHFQEVLAFFDAKNKMDQGGKTTVTAPEGSKESKKSEQEENKDGDNKASAAKCTATAKDKCDKEKCTWSKEKKECKVKKGQ